MRERDLKLNVQLKDNIAQLNQEISDREKAEAERQTTLEQLKIEMKEREVTQIQLEQQSLLPAFVPRCFAGSGVLP